MRDNQPRHRQMRKEQRRLERRKASLQGLPAVLIFGKVASGLDLACQRAQQLKVDVQRSGADVPYTDMYLLVEQFRSMQGV